MGRYGPPPNQRILNPRKLKTPVEITPQSQLAQYYGGQGGIVDAILDSKLQSDRLYGAMDDIDPNSDIRNLFPPIDYGRYGDEVTVMPIRPNDAEFTSRMISGVEPGQMTPLQDLPNVNLSEMEMADFMPKDLVPAPAQQPALLMNPDPIQFGNFGTNHDIASPVSELRGELIEKPLTDYVTGFTDNPTAQRAQPLMDSDALGEAIAEAGLRGADDDVMDTFMDFDDAAMVAELIADRTSPLAIDETLAQIRRRKGTYSNDFNRVVPYEQARGQIDSAVESAMQMARENPLFKAGYQNLLNEPTTGLPVQDLIALGFLPPEYKRFLPSRLGVLPAVGGAIAAGVGSQGNQQGIDPRSTMGPLSGLMQ